ncbi:protein CDV3 homolog isoform X2 [Pituophis catenifer annectens]|uniref:protein CDV3 homolog isoform X2 n=1 Tax=Pituophis catenifer annectens TaxID=94852 RepID=UPI003995E0FF
MAETEERSLDDFFAKRDKKKRRNSRGSATAAASSTACVTRGTRQTEGAHRDASNSHPATNTAKAAKKEEDDWKEFEQEEIIDYSGLRVQSMQISEKDEEESEKREEPKDNSEEPGGSVEKSSGPWNRSAPTQIPVAEISENPELVQSSGVYRPPGAREGRIRKVPQRPPEIYSDTQFPSLQSTAKQVDTRKY